MYASRERSTRGWRSPSRQNIHHYSTLETNSVSRGCETASLVDFSWYFIAVAGLEYVFGSVGFSAVSDACLIFGTLALFLVRACYAYSLSSPTGSPCFL